MGVSKAGTVHALLGDHSTIKDVNMNWIEIINLRAPEDIWERLPPGDLRKRIGEVTEKGFAGLTIYRRAEFNTDISIHISWDGRQPPGESTTGARLAQLFRDYGLVNHSVWIEPDR